MTVRVCSGKATEKMQTALKEEKMDNLFYEVENSGVAKVDSEGTVIAVGEGTTTITITSVDNPEITVEELMQYVKAPDFPTGGFIYGMSGVREAFETGRGRVIMRARTEIESGPQHDKIVVTEIPYNVNKAELIKFIADLVSDKRIEGISNVNDESDKDGMR